MFNENLLKYDFSASLCAALILCEVILKYLELGCNTSVYKILFDNVVSKSSLQSPA